MAIFGGTGLPFNPSSMLGSMGGSDFGGLGNLGSIFGGGLNGILGGGLGGIMGGSSGASSSSGLVQKSLQQKEKGGFKWVEEFLDPESFASSESALIGFGPATYALADAGQEFTLIGLCSSFNYSQSVNVSTLKELRAEGTRIIPGKVQPGQMNITRLLTSQPSFAATVTGSKAWLTNLQKPEAKKLFGIVITFMSTVRSKEFATLYFERCALTGMSVGVQAGNYSVYESINIAFDRVMDDTSSGSGASSYESNVMTGKGLF